MVSHLDAFYVASVDPTFTMAVCEAALERLSRHTPTYANSSDEAWQRRAACNDAKHRPWPCVEFLSDAAPFRTRPDFPEELRRDG